MLNYRFAPSSNDHHADISQNTLQNLNIFKTQLVPRYLLRSISMTKVQNRVSLFAMLTTSCLDYLHFLFEKKVNLVSWKLPWLFFSVSGIFWKNFEQWGWLVPFRKKWNRRRGFKTPQWSYVFCNSAIDIPCKEVILSTRSVENSMISCHLVRTEKYYLCSRPWIL